MNYYIKEVQRADGAQRTAGVKARDDINIILESIGYIPIEINMQKAGSTLTKIKKQVQAVFVWNKALRILKEEDVLIVQFPVVEHSVLLYKVFLDLKKRGIKIVLIIHDLDKLRRNRRKDIPKIQRMIDEFEEDRIPRICDKLIVHNDKMRRYLIDIGYEKERIISLGVFDYLIKDYCQEKMNNRMIDKTAPIIIAGSLRPHKAQYIYKIPDQICLNLFGVGYEGNNSDNKKYFGSFLPDDLPYKLEGSFGLVWDGDDSKTCVGVYGDYLRINNPHKTSLYLASGIPVAIWNQAALATFIIDNDCGITGESIEEISRLISTMSVEEYDKLKSNAEAIGKKMRDGFYLKTAITKAVSKF